MHVIVLGAGVIGVTTAYYLTRFGHRVTLVERSSSVGGGATFANGGQLSYSFTEVFAQPSIPGRLPAILAGRDPGVCVSLMGNPGLTRWSLAFLAQCTRARADRNTLQLLVLALRSRELLSELARTADLSFGHRKAGKLVVTRSEAVLQRAARLLGEKRMRGCDVALLSRDEAVGLEPALASMDGGFRGAIYGASDELGDARHFTHALFRWLVDNTPLDARFHTEAIALETDRRGFRGVRSAAGTIPGDAIVLCLGACESRSLLPAVRGPMLPARGYSVTLPRGASAPSVSITDLDNRILFSPLAERLRVTGFADFVGFTRHRDTARIATLRQVARRVAPAVADYECEDDHAWGGYRPMTPDGQPMVGATNTPGVFANLGHGALGWTLAASSGFTAASAADSWWRAKNGGIVR